jgi:hypothetical protein
MRFRCRFTKTGERSIDDRDQGGELVGRYRVASQIGGDDLGGEFGRLLIGHRFVPVFPTGNNIPTPVNSGWQMRTPHIGVGPTTPSWDRPALGEDPTGLSLNGSHTWEVERKIYGGDFFDPATAC